MDLASSRLFLLHRSHGLSLNEEDVVPVGKVESDVLWHGLSAYIGVNLRCKRCEAEFCFSAHEQKAWREEYGFSIHSYPIHCRPCRALERELTLFRKRMSAVLTTKTFTQSDFDELIDVVHALIKRGQTEVIGPRLKERIFWAGKRSLHPHREEVIQALRNL